MVRVTCCWYVMKEDHPRCRSVHRAEVNLTSVAKWTLYSTCFAVTDSLNHRDHLPGVLGSRSNTLWGYLLMYSGYEDQVRCVSNVACVSHDACVSRDACVSPQFTNWVDAVIFVFSLENETSFNAIYSYYAKMAHFRNTADVPIILVGTQGEITCATWSADHLYRLCFIL